MFCFYVEDVPRSLILLIPPSGYILTLQHSTVHVTADPGPASPDVRHPAVLRQPLPGELVQAVGAQLGGRQQRPPRPLPASVYQSSLVLGVGGLQLCPLNQATVGVVSLE